MGRTISTKYVPQIWYISANSIIQIQRNNLILENCQLLILRIQKSYFLNSLFTKSIRKECANFVDKLDLSSWSNKKRPLQRPMLFVQKAYCRPLIYFYLYLFDTRKKCLEVENVKKITLYSYVYYIGHIMYMSYCLYQLLNNKFKIESKVGKSKCKNVKISDFLIELTKNLFLIKRGKSTNSGSVLKWCILTNAIFSPQGPIFIGSLSVNRLLRILAKKIIIIVSLREKLVPEIRIFSLTDI